MGVGAVGIIASRAVVLYSVQGTEFRSYVDVPTAEAIAKLLLERKKQMLLEKYVSTQQRQSEEVSDEGHMESLFEDVQPS